MFTQESITVGSAYVNERDGLVREIVEEVDRFRVKVNEFSLRTGRLVAPALRTAYKRGMARWAQREATGLELERLHPGDRHSVGNAEAPGETQKAEHEHRRARAEQVAGASAMHRW